MSVSYIEADRRMTAEERVENVPLDDELCEWLRAVHQRALSPRQRTQGARAVLPQPRRNAKLARAPGAGSRHAHAVAGRVQSWTTWPGDASPTSAFTAP